MTEQARDDKGDADALLDRMASEVTLYDAIDQVEVLAARLWHLEQQGAEWSEGRMRLRDGLCRLPSAVEHQLRRLQILA